MSYMGYPSKLPEPYRKEDQELRHTLERRTCVGVVIV